MHEDVRRNEQTRGAIRELGRPAEGTMVRKRQIAEGGGCRRASGPAAIEVFALGRGDLRERAQRGLQIGGKAEALDELARAGLPIPPGWVVATEAYQDWLEAGIEGGLRRLGRAIAGG